MSCLRTKLNGSSKTLNYETSIHHFESGGLAKRSSSFGDSEQSSGLFDETVCPAGISVVVLPVYCSIEQQQLCKCIVVVVEVV